MEDDTPPTSTSSSAKPTRLSLNKKPRSRAWRILVRLLFIFIFLGLACVAGVLVFYGRIAGRYDLAKLGEMRERTVVLDVKGREIGRLHGENRVVVPLDRVSPYFVKALLAREDARFYRHGGVDYIGVARALYRDAIERKAVQGASTITMQLARNSFDDLSAKTAHRKLVEVMLANRIEATRSKDEILELYMNRIFFGSGLYGVERASKAYFAKSAVDMTLGESAMLAGIIRSPNRFSPFRNFKGAIKERDDVLARMVLTKVITQTEADTAKAEEVIVAAQPVVQSQENYMMEAVRRDLDVILDSQDVEDGGLYIHTTLDKDLQAAAEAALEKRLRAVEGQKNYPHMAKATFDAQWDSKTLPSKLPYLQGAILAIDNHTGGILTVVGGRDYMQSRYDRALQGARPIGSTVKPFIYAAGFLYGLLPGTLVDDAPIQPGELQDTTTNWSPENSDGKFLGLQPMSVGLVRSRNTMTVRVGNYAGLDHVISFLRDVGLGEVKDRTPQIYIGNLGASLRSLTSAMSVFPNLGVKRRPFLIKSIRDKDGQELYATPVLESEVMPAGPAFLTRKLMEKVMTEGTGAAAKQYGFKGKAGGKTGTTNDYKDAWFAGFTTEITCGVWVGLDTPEKIVTGGYGAKLSLPIWCDVLSQAEELGYKATVPVAEPAETQVMLCRVSGQLATEACQASGMAYQEKLPYEMVPQGFCQLSHQGGGPGGPMAGQPQGGEEPERKGFFRRMFRIFR